MFRALSLSILLFSALACDSSLVEDAGMGQDLSSPRDAGDAARSDAADTGGRPDVAELDLGLDAGVGPDVEGPELGTVDAAPFPIKIAYSASAEDARLLELYLTDTSTSRAKVNGPMAGGPAGGKKEPETAGLQGFKWSADGQRMFYWAQQDTYDLTELYVAPAGGVRPGAPRKLNNPAVDANSGADEPFPSFVSERVAFVQYDGTSTNLYIVSSTAAVPIPRRISQGFVFRYEWSPTAEQIVFHDIIQSMNDRDLWFAQVHPGAPPPERVNPGANLGFAGALAWAPDGSSFVYAADERALRLFELFMVTVDGGLLGTRQRLHPALPANSDVAFDALIGAAYSPDGSKLVYLADPRVPGIDDLHVIDLLGGVPSLPMVLSSTNATQAGVERFGFDPSGGLIAYATRELTQNSLELFIVDVDGTSAPIAVIAPVAGGSFHGEVWARSGELLVFMFDDGESRALYAVDRTGSLSVPIRLSQPSAVGDPGVGLWALSPDRSRLVYTFEEAAGTSSLYSLDLSDLSALTPRHLTRGGRRPLWCWSPSTNDGLAVVADIETAGVSELFWIANVDTPTFVKISGPLVAGGQVSDCAFPGLNLQP